MSSLFYVTYRPLHFYCLYFKPTVQNKREKYYFFNFWDEKQAGCRYLTSLMRTLSRSCFNIWGFGLFTYQLLLSFCEYGIFWSSHHIRSLRGGRLIISQIEKIFAGCNVTGLIRLTFHSTVTFVILRNDMTGMVSLLKPPWNNKTLKIRYSDSDCWWHFTSNHKRLIQGRIRNFVLVTGMIYYMETASSSWAGRFVGDLNWRRVVVRQHQSADLWFTLFLRNSNSSEEFQ